MNNLSKGYTVLLRIVRLLPACAQLSSLGSIDGQGLDNPRGRKPRDVEVRSVGAQVYGDLNEEVSVIADCADEVCGPVQAPTGNSGAAMDGSRLPIGANTARRSRRDNRSVGRFRCSGCRRWSASAEAVVHAEHGGPRMRCVRGKVSITSIGAPQCRHTKVGRAAPDPICPSLGPAVTTGGG